MPVASGNLHTYAPGLVAFEHITASQASTPNKLLFVGGLGDGLLTVPYVHYLLGMVGWGVIEVLTSSSYTGWGTGSVKRDAEQLALAVNYFMSVFENPKFVLMGHSTGSQDTFQYLLNVACGKAPKLTGAILQAAVSDREAIVNGTSKTQYLTSINFSEAWIKDGRGSEIIPADMRPLFPDTPISAQRWYSLAAPLDFDGNPQGAEDFFSSDLNDQTLNDTFGKLPEDVPVLALLSERDQYMPEFVNKAGLIARWKAATGGRLQGEVIEGGTHNFADVPADVMNNLVSRVEGFLKSLD